MCTRGVNFSPSVTRTTELNHCHWYLKWSKINHYKGKTFLRLKRTFFFHHYNSSTLTRNNVHRLYVMSLTNSSDSWQTYHHEKQLMYSRNFTRSVADRSVIIYARVFPLYPSWTCNSLQRLLLLDDGEEWNFSTAGYETVYPLCNALEARMYKFERNRSAPCKKHRKTNFGIVIELMSD